MVIAMVMATSCTHTAPQRPSQRNGQRAHATDSTALALLQLNSRLADEADREIAQWVQQQGGHFAMNEVGAWVQRIDYHDEGPCPQKDEEWTIAIQVYDMQDSLLLDSEQSYRIQHDELPLAVEVAIQELHHGDKARLASPWYAAYGIHGNEHVGAYKNVIIDIELR